MTDFHSRVISNEVTAVNIPRSEPEKDWVPGTNTTDDEYRARDRWPQIGSRPTAGKYQTVTGPAYTPDIPGKNVNLVYSVTDMTMDEAKAVRRQELTAAFQAHLYAGITVDVGNGPFELATSHFATQEVRGMVEYLKKNGGTVQIRTRSNANMVVNLTQAETIMADLDQHWKDNIEKDAVYGAQIDGATTFQDLENIPIETWT